MRLYVYKKVKDGSDHYNLIIAEDYVDAKNWTKARSLIELRDTPCWFSNFNGDQAHYKEIYELAKSGVKRFGISEDRSQAFYGSNKVVFAASEYFASPFKLNLDGFQTMNNMWITNKKVELTSNALVVVAMAADEDDIELMDYQVATLDVVSDKPSFFVLWDEIGTILTMDEVEAYMLLEEFTGG